VGQTVVVGASAYLVLAGERRLPVRLEAVKELPDADDKDPT